MAPLAIAAIPAVLGAVGAYKSAKDAKKQAAKGVNEQSTTTRTPYGPAEGPIQDILDAAKNQFHAGQQGPMPYAWQQFLNNPTGPGATSSGANSTGPSPGGGRTSGGVGSLGQTWNGKDKFEVRQARQERRDARNAPQANPAGAGGAQGGPGQASAPAASQGPQFAPQAGPFGYSQGLRDFMMQKYQQQGVGGYQPAMNYIQQLLGGQSQNPYLSQAFGRVSGPQQNYFSAFQPKG